MKSVLRTSTILLLSLLMNTIISNHGVYAEDIAVEQCTYEDDLGNKWDFTGIDSPTEALECEGSSCTTTTAEGKRVFANLCKPMSQDISTFCKVKSGEQIMAYAKYKNVENSCVQLGVISTFLGPTMSKVNINRLDVKYTAGENCKYDVNRKASITYSFYCDSKASTATFTLSSSDKCSYNVQIYSPKACPTIPAKTLSPFTIFLLVALGMFLLYCAFGSLYNSQVRGTSGIESIPNVDFWRNFLKHVEDGLLYVYLKITCQNERTIMHESLMQDDQLSNPKFDDNGDDDNDTKLDNVVTHL